MNQRPNDNDQDWSVLLDAAKALDVLREEMLAADCRDAKAHIESIQRRIAFNATPPDQTALKGELTREQIVAGRGQMNLYTYVTQTPANAYVHCNDYEVCVAAVYKAMRALEPASAPPAQAGKRVRKKSGYKFEGVELGTFTKRDGVTKFTNVENDDGWVMHFRPDDLEDVSVDEGGAE